MMINALDVILEEIIYAYVSMFLDDCYIFWVVSEQMDTSEFAGLKY